MIFVGLPTYDGTRHNSHVMVELAQSPHQTLVMENSCSLLARGFNELWTAALNLVPRPTHFCLIHADVLPERPFFDRFLVEQAAVGADVLSVVIPIKNGDGVTSTALETKDPWRPNRLSLTEVFARPETWTESGLLVNTGLLLVDFSKPWVESICFTIRDRIERTSAGRFVPLVEPEDWSFSRQARALGATI